MPSPKNAPYKIHQRIYEVLGRRARIGRLIASSPQISASMKKQNERDRKERLNNALFEKQQARNAELAGVGTGRRAAP